jgi:hypothetical protein
MTDMLVMKYLVSVLTLSPTWRVDFAMLMLLKAWPVSSFIIPGNTFR